ncbi:MAG: hypothetical protein QME68_01925 [Elusimicrobiota bacterium]|nr:hypothetical protein [Elusimicrobiota bacterium]
MIELTEEQRRKIYEEEKARLEKESSSAISSMIIANILAGLFLALLVSLSKYKVQPKLERLREVFEGLAPE